VLIRNYVQYIHIQREEFDQNCKIIVQISPRAERFGIALFARIYFHFWRGYKKRKQSAGFAHKDRKTAKVHYEASWKLRITTMVRPIYLALGELS